MHRFRWAGRICNQSCGWFYIPSKKKGINEKYKCEISNYIIKNGFGELYPGKQFLNAGTQELRIKKSSSRKLRALVLTRASVDLKLRKKT